jgi:hypothetical protein
MDSANDHDHPDHDNLNPDHDHPDHDTTTT